MSKFIFILFIFSLSYSSQSGSMLLKNNNQTLNFMNDYNPDSEMNENIINKNLLPTAMSLIIPGSGQFYKQQWKKGLALLGTELILWDLRKKYNDEGDDYVDKYKEFASEHWSFENWVKNYYSYINPDDPVYDGFINEDYCNIVDNDYSSSNGHEGYCAPWHEAHYIEYLNTNTGLSSHTNNGTETDLLFRTLCDENENYYVLGCTTNSNQFENIQITKDHHFYEGIGKYNLFFAGWKDAQGNDCDDPIVDNNGNLTCRWIENKNGYQVALSNYKQQYQDELRAISNKKYDKAENALTFIFINHMISMMDAFFSDHFNYKQERSTISPLQDVNDNSIKGVKISFLW